MEVIQEKESIYEKLQILSDAAKYDVVHPVGWIEKEMERAWEIAADLESVTAFRQMDVVFLC